MKKINSTIKLINMYMIILISYFVLSVSCVNAETSYFADNFENGLDKWVVAGDSWQLTDLFYRSSNHSISESPEGEYPPNANSTITMKMRRPSDLVDLSDSNNPILTFWHRIGVYSSDFCLVEVSEDNGFNWDTLESFTDIWRSTWSRVHIDLSGYKSSPIMIRFRLRANGDHQTWGWDIDDIEIKEKDPEIIPFPFFDDFESGLDNWMLDAGDAWQLNDEWYVSPTYSITESLYGNYPAYACSDLILAHPVDLSLSESPVLVFWHKIGVFGSDYGCIDISEDRGTSWSPEPLACYTDTWLSTWSREQIDLSEYKISPIMIRFRLLANGDHESWGWDIDDVYIKELFYHPAPDQLKVQITNIDNSTCPKIQASVIVTDENDEAVVGLDASNFTVYENSILQAPITVELNTSSVCASLALDYSGSMEPNALKDLETAAAGFVELMLPGDRGEIIKFAEGIEIMQEYTDDQDALLGAIQRTTTLDSSFTSFYDAIYQAISDTAEQVGNKAVIAMSDGKDNFSEYSATKVIDTALDESIPIFTIGLGDKIDEDVLIAIANKTGGIYYYAPTPDDLVAIYQKIAGTLKTKYLVTYDTTICDPNSSGDVEHELNIEVNQGMAYGQGTRRFRCPVSCNSDAVLDADIDNLIIKSENDSGQ